MLFLMRQLGFRRDVLFLCVLVYTIFLGRNVQFRFIPGRRLLCSEGVCRGSSSRGDKMLLLMVYHALAAM